MKAAKSGAQARGLAAADGPYRQDYTYDVWGNLTGRDDLLWGRAQADSGTYVNNRRQGWGYDAAGNVTRSGADNTDPWVHTFDAAGRDVLASKEWGVYGQPPQVDEYSIRIEQTYDGDGAATRRVETRGHVDEEGVDPDEVKTTYFVRSSVLGGAALAEYDPQLGWGYEKRHVYAGGGKVAEHRQWPGGGAEWWHRNPLTGSWVEAGGVTAERREVDPLGSEVGTSDPFPPAVQVQYADIYGGDLLFLEAGDPLDPRGGCGTIDGLPASCSEISKRLRDGTAQYSSFTTVNFTRRDETRGSYAGYTNLEPGLNIRFTGSEAVVAAATFEYWMPNFGFAVPTAIGAIMGPRMAATLSGGEGAGDPFRGFSSSFAPQNTMVRTKNACEKMADIAQQEANLAMSASDGTMKDALRLFDEGFSKQYLGHPVRSVSDAWNLYWNGVNDSHIESFYRGSTGFKDQYKDNQWGTVNGTDQTHHFAAYFSAGINNMQTTANVHKAGDLFQLNTNDHALGTHAYSLGRAMRLEIAWRGKFEMLKNIGKIIRERFCVN
jgi:hypothetical protein